MVTGGLKLKREFAAKAPEKPVGELVVAQIWVDANVYHLDTPFSYLIPGNLSEMVKVGSLVSVPFHGREVIGLVIEISELGSHTGLKSISKCVGDLPLITSEILELIKEACRRYAAHPFDLIRSAIPDRVAQIEKRYQSTQPIASTARGRGLLSYLQLPPVLSRSTLIAEKIAALRSSGSVLAVLPDAREVQSLSLELDRLGVDHVILDSEQSRSDYFDSFLKARLGLSQVVIGTRSAIFTPLINLSSILIYNEGSENLYEKRSPGWNARDIALLRTHNEKVDLYFIGYSPSTEIGRFIEEKYVNFKRSRGKIKVLTVPQTHGELLPSRALAPIKKSLSAGPVLFLVPLKGYAQAIRCAKCRTVSRCLCGGAHEKKTLTSQITCSHCLESVSKWSCIWCHGEQPSMQSRGIERHHQELGLLFPNAKIYLATSDHQIDEEISSGIVVCTPGMAPKATNGYSAVVILEGNRFLNQPDMRSNERIREMFFAHAALAQSGAPVILIQDDGNPVATALATWNPSLSVQRDLQERESLQLPPYVRTVRLLMETSEVTRFKSALSGAIAEGRLPSSTRLLGPIPSGEKSSLILTVQVSEGENLVNTIHEFMRRRSAAKKVLPALRIDPYSLSL